MNMTAKVPENNLPTLPLSPKKIIASVRARLAAEEGLDVNMWEITYNKDVRNGNIWFQFTNEEIIKWKNNRH